MDRRASIMELASRGDSLGFAARCKKNLLYIEQAKQSGHDVHVVTQIITSSLGLIVFPWEKKADLKIRGTLLSDLDESTWPTWDETKPSKGVGQLIHNLRNAIAHGNIQFSSDDREASNVVVTFRSESGDWKATISAQDLKNFCLRFIDFIEDTIG
jgi:HEPN pEK499 p136